MKTLIGLLLLGLTFPVMASEYGMPACYQSMPTSCGFNEMTLSFCNQEGQISGIKFSLKYRSYLPGGNKFVTGSKQCLVNKVKGSEPAKYKVEVK